MEKGQKVAWYSVNRVRWGIIVDKFYRKKDNALLGYLVQLPDNKKIVVHPKSIIQCGNQ